MTDARTIEQRLANRLDRLLPTSVEISEGDAVPPIPPGLIRMTNADGSKSDVDMNEVRRKLEQELAKHPPELRRAAANRLLQQYQLEVRKLEESKADKLARVASLKDIQDWLEAGPDVTLQKNDCSRLHNLKHAAATNRIYGTDGELVAPASFQTLLQHTFVVKHDWAAAFEHAEGIEDQIKLPYELCAFEFRMGGKTVVAVAVEWDGKPKFTGFVQSGDCWASVGGSTDKENVIISAMWDQIRAICIALDAEVATSTVVRAPLKLNEKRQSEGKIPLADYHVVDLSRRHRVANPSGGHTGGKKRLHFRRGHWRHFETTKTWVRWCLVGDPDLGFIAKRYTL